MTAAAADRPDTACTHCGLPVPGEPAGDGPHFCCSGCRTAFQILQGTGLADYYALREATGAGPSRQAVQAAAPGRYAHLDDPG
ncbi:MAG: heavy metal translocating P-type ATPase metal-binding domain-containing protein, partial [Myxococcales bacterium]|nr:heavy metal translocating P-type ATPase metal-binding domain-containing protein [Myxococcales bacterium]